MLQLATIANRRSERHVWFYLPLLLSLISSRPDALLHAAPNLTAITDAARADELSAVRDLIKERADVNATANDGSSALLWAAYHSNVDMTKALLAAGSPGRRGANHYGVTPLLQASRNGDIEIIKALLDAGAEPTRWHAEGETPLMAAARIWSRSGRGPSADFSRLVRQCHRPVPGRDRVNVGRLEEVIWRW